MSARALRRALPLGWALVLFAASARAQLRVDAPADLDLERRQVVEAIDRAMPGLEAFFGQPLQARYTVQMTATPAAFTAATEGRAPTWAVGVAIPLQRKVVLMSGRLAPAGTDIGRVAVHEVTHLFVHEVAGDDIPRWLDEGVCIFLSGEDRGASFWDLAKAIYTENALFLEELSHSFPASESQAHLAYYESYTAIQFIVRTWGSATLRDLLESIPRYGYDASLRMLFGLSRDEFEFEWYRDLRRRTRWVGWVGDGLPLAFVFSLLFIAATVRKRILVRRKLRQWEAEEEALAVLEPPARKEK